MNNNRKNFILGVLTGIFLCVAGGAAYFYLPSALSQKPPQEMAIDQAITRINNKDFKEANFKMSEVEFIDAGGAKWITAIGSEPSREVLFRAISDFNSRNPSEAIKTGQNSAGAGHGWIFLTQFFPFILLGLFTIATASLAILAYKAVFKDSGSG